MDIENLVLKGSKTGIGKDYPTSNVKDRRGEGKLRENSEDCEEAGLLKRCDRQGSNSMKMGSAWAHGAQKWRRVCTGTVNTTHTSGRAFTGEMSGKLGDRSMPLKEILRFRPIFAFHSHHEASRQSPTTTSIMYCLSTGPQSAASTMYCLSTDSQVIEPLGSSESS